MKTAVVIGCHRSGTSLVASMLAAMGVDMGTNLIGAHPSQPGGHWEDVDFVNMNNEILSQSGGTWDNPQEVDWRKFRPDVAMLVHLKQHPELAMGMSPVTVTAGGSMQGSGYPELKRKENDWWGFKDPRTCLTAACYHQYLENPHYIVVNRDKAAIIESLEWRSGKQPEGFWDSLVETYLDAIDWFVDNVNAPVHAVWYGDLTDPRTSAFETRRLAEFLGMESEAWKAQAVIRTKPQLADAPALGLVMAASLKAAAKEAGGAPAIIHLGDEDVRDAVLAMLPRARYVQIQPDWYGSWGELHGPVHALIVGEGVHREEIRHWAAKVRPGGEVVGKDIDAVHDWPATTWHHTSYGDGDNWHRYVRQPFLTRGDSFGTIGVGVPYHKPVYDFWRWFSWLLVKGLEESDEFLNDDSVMAPLPIPLVHNRLMARFLETDRDTLCLVEDDHVGDVEVIRQMRQKMENQGFDIVCANYVNRREFPSLTGYGMGCKNSAGEVICVLNWDEAAKSGTQAVDGAAMGLVLIRRWVLDAMMAGAKPSETFWCEWHGGNSQDITFYWKAREVGAKAAVDRDANIGHIAQVVRTPDDFWAKREGRA